MTNFLSKPNKHLDEIRHLLFIILAGVLFGAHNFLVTALGLVIIATILILERVGVKR